MSNASSNEWFLSNRHYVMPKHLNAANSLFGGQMMAWIDEAAAMYASCQMNTDRIVTVACSVEFKVPVEQGKTVTIYCRRGKVGNTSLTVDVKVVKKDRSSEDVTVVETSITFVALDENGKKMVWPKTNIEL